MPPLIDGVFVLLHECRFHFDDVTALDDQLDALAVSDAASERQQLDVNFAEFVVGLHGFQ